MHPLLMLFAGLATAEERPTNRDLPVMAIFTGKLMMNHHYFLGEI